MQLIDTHCHLADARLAPGIDAVIARSRSAGIAQWIVPSARSDEWDALAGLARLFDGLHPAYGIHPWYCEQHTDADLERLRGQLAGAAALGECGLDFGPARAEQATQTRWLHRQLEIAAELDLPVILHAYKSLDSLTQELKPHAGISGVVHAFAGSLPQAERLLAAGFYLGIGTRIVRPEAERLRDVVRQLPLSRICIETDAPDQPLPETRGGLNEPAALSCVLAALAEIRQVAPADLAEQCNANARELFRL